MPSPRADERSTLVGVATGTPDGGVAIVRLSGPQADAIAGTVVRGEMPPPRRAAMRRLGAPTLEALAQVSALESALVLRMPGPGSFTGEDVVELHVHAGARNVREIVGWLLEAGAHAAGAGDFTRRAFEHGRLTLDQAEGIAAVIGARTQAELEHGRRLVSGELTKEVDALRGRLGRLRTLVEATLGFPEDMEDAEIEGWRRECAAIREEIEAWLARFERGMRARSRLRVVLAGPPNAGKSALLNAMVGTQRAIVADVPGTTRDYVEVPCEWSKRALTLVDTAGLRGTRDAIEAAGVELSEAQVQAADLVLWVQGCDAAAVAMPPVVADRSPEAVVHVRNKCDLLESGTGGEGDGTVEVPLQVSAAVGGGVERLRTIIVSRLWDLGDAGWIGLARHQRRCVEAVASLRDAEVELSRGVGALELAALPLHEALGRLDAIVGRTQVGPVGAGVLEEIFSSFCIGK